MLFKRDGVWGPDLTARTEHQLSIDVFTQRGGIPPRAWPAPNVNEIRSGNVIEGAPTAGIWIGWGRHMRNVAATGNVVRDCGIGIPARHQR